MILRVRFVFCALFYSVTLFALETAPVIRQTEPQIPAYLLRKPEVYNPFKGLFQNWENRQTDREESISRINKYTDAMVKVYPKSKAGNIRLFMQWHFWGNKNLKIAPPTQAKLSDPWAEAIRMIQFFNAGNSAEGYNILRKLLRELPANDLLRFELMKIERHRHRASSSEYKYHSQRLAECVENIVLSGKYINSVIYQQLYNELSTNSHCGSRYWGRLEGRLKPHAAKLDPWFWEMIQGRAAIAWAWESRGGGWSNTVSEEGWSGFGKNLEKARKHFYRAIELFPERTNAHIQLITVEMGGGSREDMINVFKKLVQHHPANESGWNKLLWGLLPRWGGSLDLIKMLAIEAMDCPRRDSKVQYCGYQALADIAKYHGNYRWQRVYMDPDVFDRSERVFQEYSESLTDAAARRRFLGYKVCRYLALLEYGKALASANERGGINSMKNWWHWGFHPSSAPVGSAVFDDLSMRLTVFTGKYGAELQKAERLFVSGTDDAQALSLLADVVKKDDLIPQEKDYLIDLYGRWRLNCSPEEFLDENGKYKSAYVVAGQYNRSDVAAEMRDLGYNITANENFPGESVYNIASEGENIDGLKKLHASGAKLTLPSPKTGHTPIHAAARYGNAEMVKTLLDLGVPVELKDRNGHTALHIAATKKYSSVIEVLFAAGADPNMGDNEDDFCLIYLPQVRAPYRIWKLFIDHPQINVNRQNHAGVSSLHYMAKWNTPIDIFELMFSKGANINIRDNSGRTPLDMAEAAGLSELVSFLVGKGAKRNRDLPQVRPQAASKPEMIFDYALIQPITVMLLPVLIVILLLCRRSSGKNKSGKLPEKFNPANSNFEAYHLQVTQEYIKVKPTLKLFFFYIIFAGLGLSAMIASFIAELHGESALPMEIGSTAFFILGLVLISNAYNRSYPYIDLQQRAFYPLGKKSEYGVDITTALPLDEAEKMYISSEIVQGKNNSYLCYTVTIVYPDNKKYILLRHGSLKAIKRDVKLLAKYTGLPEPDEIVAEESVADEKNSGLFLLIFSVIWTAISFSLLYIFLLENSDDPIPPVVFGLFVLVGLIIGAFGIRVLIKKSPGGMDTHDCRHR